MYANNFYHKRERQIRNAHNRLTVLGKKLSFPIVKRSESTVGALERRYVERARVVLIKQQKKVSISSIVFSIFFAFQLCLFEVVCVNIEQMRSGQCFILFHFICFCFANWKQNGLRKHPNKKNPTKKQQQLLFIFPARLCVRRKNHLKCALDVWTQFNGSMCVWRPNARIDCRNWSDVHATNCILSTLIE